MGYSVVLSKDCLTFARQRSQLRTVPHGLMPNCDIWEHLDAVFHDSTRAQRTLHVQHVRAHRDLSEASSPEEAFFIRGGQEADDKAEKGAALGPLHLQLRA